MQLRDNIFCIAFLAVYLNKSARMWNECEMYALFFSGTEEFAAHTPNVNCLALGHKSGRVLVTGGDDKKVNLWAVGKQNCIMVIVAQ